MKKIEKLTKKQEEELVEHRAEWLRIGQSSEPIDESKTREILIKFYIRIGKKPPRFMVFDSPMQACVGAPMYLSIISGKHNADESKKLAQQICNARYPQRWWCSWVAFYRFCEKIGVSYSKENSELLREWDELSRACHWFFPFENYCILSRAPVALTVDSNNRLHSAATMAIRYADGWGDFYWHGIKVPSVAIETPDKVTVEMIDSENNSEVKRALIEIFGSGRYIQESGAEEVHRDEFGVLLRKDDLLTVRVCNATTEPDGPLSKAEVLKIFGRPRWMTSDMPKDSRFKEYFLTVHPELRPMIDETSLGDPQKLTARNAVASTFGLRGEEYAPTIET